MAHRARRPRLETLGDVRSELARAYRDLLAGRIDQRRAGALVHVLRAITETLRAEQPEQTTIVIQNPRRFE